MNHYSGKGGEMQSQNINSIKAIQFLCTFNKKT